MKEVKTKDLQKRTRKAAMKIEGLPFTTLNYQIFVVGIAVIILGYVALAQPPANSFISLTLAPILLVIGYCVIIPIAILYQRKKSAAPGETSRNGR